jgi:hypothetical protein
MSDHPTTTNGTTASNRALDERLRRLMQPPSQERLAAIADRAIHAVSPIRATRRSTPLLRKLVAAAAVAAAVVGVWLIDQSLRPPGSSPPGAYTPEPWRSLETAYNDWLADGFEPMWVCADDREFIDTFRTTYQQGLLLGSLPQGTTALGLTYCNSISSRTTCLLATVDGIPVAIFVDRVERDHPQPQPEGLHLHRRRIDRLVLYELSPVEQPAVLPWFTNPDDGDR